MRSLSKFTGDDPAQRFQGQSFYVSEMVLHGLLCKAQFLRDDSVEDGMMLRPHRILGSGEKKAAAVFEIEQIEQVSQHLHRYAFAGNFGQGQVKLTIFKDAPVQGMG